MESSHVLNGFTIAKQNPDRIYPFILDLQGNCCKNKNVKYLVERARTLSKISGIVSN